MDSSIHANQRTAAAEIMAYFRSGVDHVILMAQMQSGKTGTAKCVVHQLVTEGLPREAIFFICGMNDNDLLAQAQREFAALLPADNILFSKQLQAYTSGSRALGGPIRCVILDESHYASNRDSLVDQFFATLTQRYLTLSVSATPMAELAGTREAHVGRVTLQPGPGYYGLRDLFAAGLIAASIDITHFQDQFIDLVVEECAAQQADDRRCYNLVRLPNQWYYRDLEDELNPLGLDLAFINHHSEASEGAPETDFNRYLGAPPAQTTIIWIYGGLRAGKQLNTTHLGFVHDTAQSRPDTIAQSLLGRILGYGKAAHGVRCFTDLAAATRMLHWVQQGFAPECIPAGSRGILHGYTGEAQDWTYHPPLAVQLTGGALAAYRDQKMTHGNRYPYREALFADLIHSATGDRALVERILTTYAPGKCGGLMILTENNVARSYRENWGLNYKRYLAGQPVGNFLTHSGGRHAGHYYVYVDLHRHSGTYGWALVVYKEGGEALPPSPPRYLSVGACHVGECLPPSPPPLFRCLVARAGGDRL